ncbi:DUF4190 domain-containing protein [Leucobacter viscericola]|uniref:DUF4190 domain-containing protein n=1 Tax=Leucobacter viscericola TaxID=2714935 RepID=A0A6G7XIA3_9MICO|nr:DUF4190 domain-containing protein [Leucobacter viscericola]QIK64098.1 DUF4190 domain-containing protein [Leucobacter viscericola]
MTTTTFAAIEATADTSTMSTPAAEPTAPSAPGADFAATQATEPTPAPAPTAASNRGFAITSFVLGIASVVAGWTFVAPIIGFVLGMLALRRGTSERTLALWGVWINGVILGLAAIGILFATTLIGAGLLTLPIFFA